jgi:hypothetical protein
VAGGLAAAFAAAALPAVAGATDYCVDATPACGPKNVASFQQALTQAAGTADADRVFLGAGVYTAPTVNGFDYNQLNSPVEIAGQGAGQTTLTSPPGSSTWVLRLVGGPGSSVHDLTIGLPMNAAHNFSGLHTSNVAGRIEVVEDPSQNNVARYGVDLVAGGSLEDSTIRLDGAESTTAVELVTPDVAVRRSTLSARVGAESHGGTIERSRVSGAYLGIHASRQVTAISGSLIRFTEATGFGIYAEGAAGANTVVNADGVTIVGPGQPNTVGAGVGGEVAPADAVDTGINLTNTIIRGVSSALNATPTGAGKLTISASYSDYDPSGNYSAGTASISEANVSNVGDARFVDAAGGDYHLLPGSPLIDAGDPATPQGLDLDGNPLVADGNGDGIARRDLGAFEFHPAPAGGGGEPAGTSPIDRKPPLVSGFRATPSVFVHRTRFRYTLSEPAQVKLTIQRRIPGRRARYRTLGKLTRSGAKGPNGIRFRGRISGHSLRRGSYRALISATDTAGNRSTRRTARFRVARG